MNSVLLQGKRWIEHRFCWLASRACLPALLLAAAAFLWQPARGQDTDDSSVTPRPDTQQKIQRLITDIAEPEALLELHPRKAKLITTASPVARFSVTNPQTVDVVQYTPTEFEVLGLETGETTLTLWFEAAQPGLPQPLLRYLVRVSRDDTQERQTKVEYEDLQKKINEMFPNSMVQLIPFSDKLIVRGHARDSKEASEILSLLAGEVTDSQGRRLVGYWPFGFGGGRNLPVDPNVGFGLGGDLLAGNIVSLLEVPSEQQILLKVRVAEISRTALRQMGMNLQVLNGDFSLTSMFGVGGPFSAVLNTDEVRLALEAVSSNAYSKILAEPNLVTLNGQPADFLAGGQFAVPTVVGVEGVGAATTHFQGVGAQITFTPTVIDKDRIRLVVSPSFSTLNTGDLQVGEIPGLNMRAVNTTVDLREGQWLALAGLLQDEQHGAKTRVPLLGDLPILETIFSRKEVGRGETELLIMVSPEIIHPIDAKEVPLILPGMEVTEPTDCALFLRGRIEGRQGCDHRSTVWPTYRERVIEAKHRASWDSHRHAEFQQSEQYYTYGPTGFTE